MLVKFTIKGDQKSGKRCDGLFELPLLGKGSVRGRSSETPRMKQTVGQLLTYEHELRDLSNQVRASVNDVTVRFNALLIDLRFYNFLCDFKELE